MFNDFNLAYWTVGAALGVIASYLITGSVAAALFGFLIAVLIGVLMLWVGYNR